MSCGQAWRHLGFSKSLAIAFLLFVKGFSRRRLGLQKIVPFLCRGESGVKGSGSRDW